MHHTPMNSHQVRRSLSPSSSSFLFLKIRTRWCPINGLPGVVSVVMVVMLSMSPIGSQWTRNARSLNVPVDVHWLMASFLHKFIFFSSSANQNNSTQPTTHRHRRVPRSGTDTDPSLSPRVFSYRKENQREAFVFRHKHHEKRRYLHPFESLG